MNAGILLYSNMSEHIEEVKKSLSNEEGYEVEDENVYEYLDFEYSELINDLNIRADIVAIADLGFWFGRRQGYSTFNNVKNIFFILNAIS